MNKLFASEVITSIIQCSGLWEQSALSQHDGEFEKFLRWCVTDAEAEKILKSYKMKTALYYLNKGANIYCIAFTLEDVNNISWLLIDAYEQKVLVSLFSPSPTR